MTRYPLSRQPLAAPLLPAPSLPGSGKCGKGVADENASLDFEFLQNGDEIIREAVHGGVALEIKGIGVGGVGPHVVVETEGNRIIRRRTRKRTRGIIVRVVVRPRASVLENLRVHRRSAARRQSVRAAAAVLISPERLARAPASPHAPRPQLLRADPVQIRRAPGRSARALPARCLDHHRQVVPINEADVVEVLGAAGADHELDEGCQRRGAGAVAIDPVGAAVAGDAGALAGGGVEGAAGTGPEPARPGGLCQEGAGRTGIKLETGGAQVGAAGAGEYRWPHGVVASVY
ncbi:glycine--tRNA ligase beta subunit [Striga asiatica]|uniref:Glycine--tRNA ligase beta subunit n=1 Tax=Striga asiatica TaxID=4170 RepID=A0A5A7QHI6_STRAF|nr:glycine--tRNA ligase beta subunit [Striga asiatica]